MAIEVCIVFSSFPIGKNDKERYIVYISNIKDICEALGGFNSIFPIPSPSIKLPSFLIHGASCQLHLVIREGPSNYKLLVKSIELFVIKLIMNNFKYQGKRKYINI